ncbi:chromosome condensation complex protein [Favolaschia claudopus]|uniref:Chromosome condensation complex protein n=1 Tax=Favolaschia claudopus TaxID=2862362 RepID=A0AAW0C1N4_9AGAR
MPARTLPAVNLQASMAAIFDQAQTTTANHQKNIVALHKLHLEIARTKSRAGEVEFESVFHKLVARVLPVKKGVNTADRVIKFVGNYTKFLNERAADERAEQDDMGDDTNTDTPASRFTDELLEFLLRGFQAKDKVVRYRVVSIVGEMIIVLGELDDEIYNKLRKALLDRIRDKEAMVRLQVVIALSKIAASEDTSEDAPEEEGVLQVLIETLSKDSSPEVRRATLVNLPVNTKSLPALLDRARDTEPTVRKLLYSSVLVRAVSEEAHPTILTVAQREHLVRHGLGDRETAVRSVAADLFGTWVDVIGEKTKPDEELATRITEMDISKTEAKPSLNLEDRQKDMIKTLVAFLAMFDLQVSAESSQLAWNVLTSVFDSRPNIFEELYFGNSYFEDLSPEKAFLARVFVDKCVEDKNRGEARMEDAGVPVVTHLAFKIQVVFNDLVELNEGSPEDEDQGYERQDKEFVLGELLRLAVKLDYSDEIGRRMMFKLAQGMLARDQLPLTVVPPTLDLYKLSADNERDFIRLVVEIIGDLREPGDADDLGAADQTQDSIDPDTSFGSNGSPVSRKSARERKEMSEAEQADADDIDIRCLTICTGMLERVHGTIDQNSTLEGILHDLIKPSVERNEHRFKEKGLLALGHFCLISEPVARNNLHKFISEVQAKPDEPLKINLFKVIFDILLVHGRTILAPEANKAQGLLDFLVYHLEQETNKEDTSPRVLALLGSGIAKLLIRGRITDERVLKSLMLVYLSPYNSDNQELKQFLALFCPTYSRLESQNQQRMRAIFLSVFRILSEIQQKFDTDNEVHPDTLNLSAVAGMWTEWTDPTQLFDQKGAVDPFLHVQMADDTMRFLLSTKLPKEDKRALCQMLLKLNIPDEVDADQVRTLKLLINNIFTRRPLGDAIASNALKKFDAALQKKFEKELEGLSEEEYREFNKLQDLFAFLDDIIPENDDEVIELDTKKKGRKRRSDSIISITTDGDDMSVASSRRGKSKPSKKRRRLSTSDDEDSDSEEDNHTAKGTPPPPTRTLPKRSAAPKKEVILISSDDDEDVDTTPAPRKGRPQISTRTRKTRKEEEAQIDAEINHLLSNEEPSLQQTADDSIMDNDSDEEDADEVTGQLLGSE